MEEMRVRVYIDGRDLGTVSRAIVGRSDGEESGMLVNTEIELRDAGMVLENFMNEEARGGKNSFMITLELPDGRKFNGTHAWVREIVAGNRLSLCVGRGGWAP